MTDDDAAIASALEDLSVPTLMLSLVHMTGDPKWIRGDIKPQGLFLNEVQGFMPEEEFFENPGDVQFMDVVEVKDVGAMQLDALLEADIVEIED